MLPCDTVNFVYMKAVRSNHQLFADGQQFEKAGKWEDAAAAYQRVVDNDPGNREAVARLLVVYRKLKDPSRELAVIDAAIHAVADRDKTAQREWISAHPEAAKLGKAVLKQLGGESVTAYGTDPFVEKLMKRRVLVEKKTGGGKKKRRKKAIARKETTARKETAKETKKAATKRVEAARKKKEAAARKAEARKEQAAAARRAETERKKKEAAERQAAAERKRKEVEARKAAKEAEAGKRRAEKEAKAHPSLFIVSLRYLVPLERIDAALKDHGAFLDKHFAQKEFLVAGRMVPRTGGIILVRAKDREAVEKIMKQDPFVKRRLASVDIVEFVASKTSGRIF